MHGYRVYIGTRTNHFTASKVVIVIVVKLQVSMTKVAPHCKNKLVVLTRVVALVADKLERQWLLEFALMLKTNCIRQPQSYFPFLLQPQYMH